MKTHIPRISSHVFTLKSLVIHLIRQKCQSITFWTLRFTRKMSTAHRTQLTESEIAKLCLSLQQPIPSINKKFTAVFRFSAFRCSLFAFHIKYYDIIGHVHEYWQHSWWIQNCDFIYRIALHVIFFNSV